MYNVRDGGRHMHTKGDREIIVFAMHMPTSANQNTKKHLEEVKEHLQI